MKISFQTWFTSFILEMIACRTSGIESYITKRLFPGPKLKTPGVESIQKR